MSRPGFQKPFSIALLVILSIHVLFALGFTFIPGFSNNIQSSIGKVYSYLVHLGPFYREETIKSTPHFVAVVKDVEIDLIDFHARQYQTHPWKTNELILRDFVRRSADAFSLRPDSRSSGAYLNLRRATSNYFPVMEQNDSVQWIYFHRYYNIESNSFSDDTVFAVHFSWNK